MMKLSLLAATVLLASTTGCAAMHRNVSRANDDLYQGSERSRAKMAGWIYDDGKKVPLPPAEATRYCYDVRTDIVCYDQPRPDLRNIVGAEGYGNNAGAYQNKYYQNHYYGDGTPPNPVDTANIPANDYRSGSDVVQSQPNGFVPDVPSVASDGSASVNSVGNSAFNQDPAGDYAPRALIGN